MTQQLPLFPENEFQIGDTWVTKKHLQNKIKELFPVILDRSCIHSSFDQGSGEVKKKYAWNSVYSDINRAGLAEKIIEALCDAEELNDK